MRHKNDFYPTPSWATRMLMHQMDIPVNERILEPCNGRGAISSILRETGFRTVFTNDIDIGFGADSHLDAVVAIRADKPDWTITNPPFNDAFRILTAAYEHSQYGVCFLLRLSFLEPTYDRQNFLMAHPPTQLIVLPRISFTGDGKTDSVTAAWMIWEKFKTGTITVYGKD